jgi:hypothetical protein
MVFTDGTPPTDSILDCFLCLCEQYINENSNVVSMNNEIKDSNTITTNTNINSKVNVAGAVAVHCKG